VVLVSSSNKWVKYVKKLSRRRFRDREGKFVLEGVRAVEEGLKASDIIEIIMVSPRLRASERGEQLIENAGKTGITTVEVSDNVMAGLSDTETPQGVLAVARRRNEALAEILDSSPSLLVLVDGVQDPGNLGTIVRTAAGAGAQGMILLPGTVDLYNPKTLRSSMGNIFQLPIIDKGNRKEILHTLEDAGLTFITGDPGAQRPVYGVDLTVPVVIVVGSEAHGVQSDILALTGYRVIIPMAKGVESLNVAVAAGIMLYEVIRQRHN